MKKHIVVLDIGTTTAKTVIFSTTGETIASESVAFQFLDKPVGYYEQDPLVVFQAIIDATIKSVASAKKIVSEFHPVVISIVCQGGSIIPCDENGHQLYPMITWMDSRAKNITAGFAKNGMDKEIHEKSGFLPSPGLPLSMILWMREYEKTIFNKTKKWLCLNDYVIKKLTGIFATGYSSAGLTQLFDIKNLDWDKKLLYFAGLTKDQLSEVKMSDDIIGNLLPEVAKLMHLPSNLPIVNGVHDRSAEAIGLGMYNKGDSWIGTGTAWVLCTIIEKNDVCDELTSNFHVLEGRRIASTLVGGLGVSIEWWVAELAKKNGKNRTEILKELTEMVKQSPVGSNGLVFKTFTGVGNEGTFLSEKETHTDCDRSRAIYEAIAYDFKKEYLEFSKYADIKGTLTIVGGATRCSAWPTIISEIIGSDIEVSQYPHDPSLGAAILAGKYLELASSYEDIFKIFRTNRDFLSPNKEHVQQYEKLYHHRLKLIGQ